MPIPFTCPSCGLITDVADHYGGQSGLCAACGKPISVPPPAPDESTRPAPPPATTPGKGKLLAATLVATLAIVFGLVGVTAVFSVLRTPRFTSTPAIARQRSCENNLRRIGLALRRYHDVHGTFPPAYVADSNGTPMHSWRVLLLPYLDETTLYQQYDFTKPWDNPMNMHLAQRMPDVYGCPDDPDASQGETSYLAITGTGPVFEGDRGTSLQDVSDGAENTVLVVESVGGAVPWHAPLDLEARRAASGVNRTAKGGICSRHTTGGAHVLMADGTVHFFPSRVPAEVVQAMLTRGGGELVAPQDFASY